VRESLLDLGQSPSPQRLAEWFETVVTVLRAAAGSPEFYNRTTAAVVSLVGLDRALVILRPEGQWTVMARFPDNAGLSQSEFSHTILNRVEKERRTFFQSEGIASISTSIQGVEAVVASPIFGSRDQVVGVLYGSRTRHVHNRGLGIGALDAQVMQMLASTLGLGLARQQHEADARRLRGQFEQFFSARLAAELERDPGMLDGRERLITVLSSDIRKFSHLAERLGPRDTCLLVSDVMERLCGCVEDQEGVVVDYSGDSLMAMWNAPADQPEHASQACRAALAMLEELPALSTRWTPRLGRPLQLGIGVNTGPALCGNIGSTHRFKYGPLGNSVNLASRVEGATKQLGVPLLITGSTQALLRGPYQTRRLCKVRVVGIHAAVDLYELHSGETITPQWVNRCQVYENALKLFESGKFAEACRALANVLSAQIDREQDGPSLSLMARAIDAMKAPPEPFDGVLELNSK
jgi:adenylate cyclase